MADVRCRVSKDHRCHETTEHYMPDRTTIGRMLRLKDSYRRNGWNEFSPFDSYDALQCPECGMPYPGGNGRVILHDDTRPQAAAPPATDQPAPECGAGPAEALQCDLCGKTCATQAGLVNHRRMLHGK